MSGINCSVELRPTPANDSSVLLLMEDLNRFLASKYPAEANHIESIEDLLKPNVVFVAAWAADTAVGCGAVKIVYDQVDRIYFGEIKRVYVADFARGRGISQQIMKYLEDMASAAGATVVRLEAGNRQLEALGLYESRGYRYRDVYHGYEDADISLSVFMEKTLFPVF